MPEKIHPPKKPHWTETAPNGEPVFCFKERKHGEKIVHRYTLRELAEILNAASTEKRKEAR